MRERIERDAPDVVLLDIRLPGEDGLVLARYLREHYDVGIIMVTASGDVVDRVVGLELGADDYVAKPFDLRELLARVKSVLRRLQAKPPREAAAAAAADSNAATHRSRRQRFGRCEIDVESRRLFETGGSEVTITAMEYDLLTTSSPIPTGCCRATSCFAHAQPRMGAVRPLDRHPHRPPATQDRARSVRRAALHPDRAQRRLHVRPRSGLTQRRLL